MKKKRTKKVQAKPEPADKIVLPSTLELVIWALVTVALLSVIIYWANNNTVPVAA